MIYIYFSSQQESGKQFCRTFEGAPQTWAQKSNLDYLSLDFNSASPSPVQKVCFKGITFVQFCTWRINFTQNSLSLKFISGNGALCYLYYFTHNNWRIYNRTIEEYLNNLLWSKTFPLCIQEYQYQYLYHYFSTIYQWYMLVCISEWILLKWDLTAPPFYVSQKPFLSDEHKVDYVQVDEKKTQALQNTKMEWTDVRQSKTWKRIGAFGFKKTSTTTSKEDMYEEDQKHCKSTFK